MAPLDSREPDAQGGHDRGDRHDRDRGGDGAGEELDGANHVRIDKRRHALDDVAVYRDGAGLRLVLEALSSNERRGRGDERVDLEGGGLEVDIQGVLGGTEVHGIGRDADARECNALLG